MSEFLGHIHFWLYNKIRRVIEREQMIYDQAEQTCGTAAEELRVQVRQMYGNPLADKDLGQLIDQTNIHGWLQRQINIAETREAAFVKELLDMCGEAGRNGVERAFAEHGKSCGEHAKAQGNYQADTASGIYQALQDYYLNGMPCDQADMVVENSSEKVVWEGGVCLQEGNWKRAGVSAKSMKDFYQTWLAGFVQGLNPTYSFVQTGDMLQGNPVNRYEILKNLG
jgi:hypothetical protein